MPDPLPRVVWDSCTIIAYLQGDPRAADCQRICDAGDEGRIQIVVSSMAEAEVIRVGDPLTDEQEDLIEEFFDRPYVLHVSVDRRIAQEARRLSRTYVLKSPDAIHVATALLTPGVRALESFDDDDMNKVRNSKVPLPRPLIIRHATYEGPPDSMV